MTTTALIANVDRILANKGTQPWMRRQVRSAILEATQPVEETNPTSASQICKQMADVLGISPADLRVRGRKAELVIPRQVCMYILYIELGSGNLSSIGRYFGGRDHTTVLHSIKNVTSALKVGDPRVLYYYNLYKQKQDDPGTKD